jgi:hypothetical protein
LIFVVRDDSGGEHGRFCWKTNEEAQRAEDRRLRAPLTDQEWLELQLEAKDAARNWTHQNEENAGRKLSLDELCLAGGTLKEKRLEQMRKELAQIPEGSERAVAYRRSLRPVDPQTSDSEIAWLEASDLKTLSQKVRADLKQENVESFIKSPDADPKPRATPQAYHFVKCTEIPNLPHDEYLELASACRAAKKRRLASKEAISIVEGRSALRRQMEESTRAMQKQYERRDREQRHQQEEQAFLAEIATYEQKGFYVEYQPPDPGLPGDPLDPSKAIVWNEIQSRENASEAGLKCSVINLVQLDKLPDEQFLSVWRTLHIASKQGRTSGVSFYFVKQENRRREEKRAGIIWALRKELPRKIRNSGVVEKTVREFPTTLSAEETADRIAQEVAKLREKQPEEFRRRK